MNRKITLAVGTAAAVAFTGVASASDMLTINQTEGYVGSGLAANFIPTFVGDDCDAVLGATSTTGCADHGFHMVAQAVMGIFWSSGMAVPLFPSPDPDEDQWALVGPTGSNPFGSGIFRENGTSYWTGLNFACNTVDDANGVTGALNCAGMGAPPDYDPPGPNTAGGQTRQQEWIDQTVIGYVESIRDANGDDQPDTGGDVTLAQNFRIQFNMTGTSLQAGAVGSHIDQRLEQMVELDGATGFMDGDASRQTLQQAFGVNASSSGNPTADGGGGHFMLGNLVAQDIEGFFFSCMSCDSDVNSGDHAVTPSLIEVRYQPYLTGWDVVPTITHGGVAP